MIGFKKLAHKITNLLLALFIISAQLFAPISAIIPKAVAANEITANNHEGQLKPAGTYSNGNITTYSELDSINFRFTLTSSAAASGQMQVRFTGGDQFCDFFTNSFVLGTHDNSAPPVASISGAIPTVATVGTPTVSSDEWVQVLSVNFANSGQAVVNYYLTLTDEAGDCNGSSQHSRLNNVNGPAGGGFANIGAQNVPIPAKDIIELATITVTKNVDTNGDGIIDRTATAGEWTFSLNGGTPVGTNANGQVIFANLPTGSYTVTESGPAGYSFLGVTGTNCVPGNVSGTATASVTAAPTAVNATCNFSNGVSPGKIKIVKNAVPNNLTDFGFTASGTGVSSFTLDDDSGVAGADNTFSNEKQFNGLVTGDYVFTEAQVSGWDLTAISCSEGANVTKDLVNRKVTVHLAAGNDVTCTFENKQRGQVIVTKQTLPDGDTTQFPVTISGDGSIHSTATQNVTDGNSVTYTVGHGTFDVNETVPNGWSVNETDCQDKVINGNTALVNGIPTVSCTITNTKLAILVIIKNALPNHEQDFAFTTSGTGLTNFSLDDDSDGTLPSQQTFSHLTPNQQYSVTEQATPGWSLTGLSCNDVAQQGSTATVTPTPGQTITCTFTNTKLISVSGTKYTSNATGGLGAVLSGWTIYIDSNNNGVKDDGEQSDVTDVNGDYSFSDLLFGTTIVLREVLQAGWTQIFGPSSFTLDSANDVTDKDFGNFKNGSISGFKWNDKNADDVVNDGEEKLNGWTITLYNDGDDIDTDLDDIVTSTVTAGDGAYSFTNLAPGTYAVCETQQGPAWVQTFPNGNGCHTIVINESDESNQANFGNQGRGTITVVKNVDTDGDGQINDQDVTTWTWDIDATGNFATGSGNSQGVAAGTHTVSEDQQANYHVTASSCTGETAPQSATTSLSVTVSPGENVTCTFTNTRDTGTIEVIKNLNPTVDDGTFDLRISGVTKKENASHGDTTGAVQVVTGNYDVSELAGDENTSLSDYSTTLTCTKNGQLLFTNIATTDSDDFTVATGDTIVCTFTNVRYGHIIVEKQTLPNGSLQSFDFTAEYDSDGFSLTDGQQDTSGGLLPETYTVAETGEDGWDLTSAVCDDQSPVDAISLQAGETVTCVFTNTQRGSIAGTKYEVDAEATAGFEGDELEGWTIELYNDGDDEDTDLDDLVTSTDTNGDGNYNFNDLKPGTYKVCEVLQDGWTQIFPEGKPGCYTIVIDPGENSTDNDFGNFKNGSITGYKFNDHNGNSTQDDGDEKLEGWEITLFQGLDIVDTTNTDVNGNYSFTNLAPGSYVVCETDDRSGWVQTSPDPTINEGCYDVVIGESDEEETAIFGNQGRGSVQVIKNVDNNGDGDTDDEGETGATNWFWDLDGTLQTSSDVATGQSLDVPAGDYSVSEDMQTDYHFVSVNCTVNRQTIEVAQGESVNITVNPGDAVVCTFENARNTATITVEKQLVPESDNGLFDLFVGEEKVKDDASDGDSGSTTVLTNTNYTVSETGNEGTDLSDYISQYSCTNEQDGTGTSVQVSLANHGDQLTCTFTNTRRPTITIIKDAVSTNSDDLEQDFGFTTGENLNSFTLDDNGNNADDNSNTKVFNQLTPGEEYVITESEVEGWDLTDINCGESSNTVVDQDNRKVTITPEAGQNVTCTFENTAHGNIVVIKDAVSINEADLAQDFCFTIDEADLLLTLNNESLYEEYLEGCEGFLLDDDDDETLSNTKTTEVSTGWYTITEDETEGWDLADIDCDNDEIILFDIFPDYSDEDYSRDVFVAPGQTITCTFVNEKRAEVVVTKYNDFDRDGEKDENEPTLPGWDMNLVGDQHCEFDIGIGFLDIGGNISLPCFICELFDLPCSSEYGYDKTQTTGEDGTTTFTGVKPNEDHFLSETVQEDWTWSNTYCEYENRESYGQVVDDNNYEVYASPGESVKCFVGNYRDAYMLIEKTNNRPEPTVVGDTVTYTLTVTVPEDSNPVYDATVTDLPPEGFNYIPGSETATQGSLTTPYASPGIWSLGDLFPGDVVVLTYKTLIANSASAGTYPDLAFAEGCDIPVDGESVCGEENAVLANVTNVNEDGTPFVGTEVTIKAPQVLAANTTVLVNTGAGDIWRNLAVGTLLMGVALATLSRREKKGYRL